MKWILTLLATALRCVPTKKVELSTSTLSKREGRYEIQRYRLNRQIGVCTSCGSKLYTNYVIVLLPLSPDGEREVVWSKLCSRKCAGEILLKFM
jgi:hypothetical protein